MSYFPDPAAILTRGDSDGWIDITFIMKSVFENEIYFSAVKRNYMRQEESFVLPAHAVHILLDVGLIYHLY